MWTPFKKAFPYYPGATLKQTKTILPLSFYLGLQKNSPRGFLRHPICIVLPGESSFLTSSVFIFLRKSVNTVPSVEGTEACPLPGGWRVKVPAKTTSLCLREMQVKE